MDNRLTQAPIFRDISDTFTKNGMRIRNNCVGYHNEQGYGKFLFVSEIEPLFRQYNNGMKNMEIFLKGEFNYCRPNADIRTFLYDPFTGDKINWDDIRKAILGH